MPKSVSIPLDAMRAYRACLNCRNRKSKCDLNLNQGRPPCRRCQRENKECILGESHRGGRRVRKKPKLEDGVPLFSPNLPDITGNCSLNTCQSPHHSPPTLQPEVLHNSHRNWPGGSQSWNQVALSSIQLESKVFQRTQYPDVGVQKKLEINSSEAQRLTIDQQSCNWKKYIVNSKLTSLQEGIVAANLQNPADALEILLWAANQKTKSSSCTNTHVTLTEDSISLYNEPTFRANDNFHYEPVQKEMISIEAVYSLFERYTINFKGYEMLYHPYFPLIASESLGIARLPWMSRNEPHLFAAILTISSRENEQIYNVCYNHLQKLISMIIAGAKVNIEAVEALILLSQWVPQRPHASYSVESSEEDQTAWMYTGMAIRLAYHIGLDRAALMSEKCGDLSFIKRQQLVWAACYICDRQVSVRLGKRYWEFGPAPIPELNSSELSNFQHDVANEDDRSSIFEANFEIAQILSKIQYILFPSDDPRWKTMTDEIHANYFQEFQFSSPRVKISLLLTHNYLRLYLHAFTLQATSFHTLNLQKEISPRITSHTSSQFNSFAFGSRSVHEALNTAKSLLSAFNQLIDPAELGYMPNNFYFFVLYAAVFLYKLVVTATLAKQERLDVRVIVKMTIDRFQKADISPNHVAGKYYRLLDMLWRHELEQNADIYVQSQTVKMVAHASNSFLGSAITPKSDPGENSNFKMQQISLETFETECNSTTGPNYIYNHSTPVSSSWADLEDAWNYTSLSGFRGGDTSVNNISDTVNKSPSRVAEILSI
ncbi:unnamed protein product [Blumeria hordei]|uniref:Zn(2)-C6 fungal-type domain-containing protein n=1 Tax=Blumeria hordei TaxID=2867405 RepID=A0A383UP15_BLUHO|nr:unnamed protein product [Blumeria hordei]